MSLPEFITFLKAHQLSPKTIRNYRSDVNQFLNWLTPRSFSEVGSGNFQNYKTHLESQSLPHSTLTRHLSALRQFARFLNLDIDLHNPPLLLVPNILKNFRSHLTKNRYKHKTIANYLSDIRHYLTWAENRL